MTDPGDQVKVFHFFKGISSAKMKKYKLATERGMNPIGQRPSNNHTTIGPVITPAPQIQPIGDAMSSSSDNPERPAKRPRSESNVSIPGADDRQHAPTEGSAKYPRTLRIKYSNDMQFVHSNVNLQEPLQGPVAPGRPIARLRECAPDSPQNAAFEGFMHYYVLEPEDEHPVLAHPPTLQHALPPVMQTQIQGHYHQPRPPQPVRQPMPPPPPHQFLPLPPHPQPPVQMIRAGQGLPILAQTQPRRLPSRPKPLPAPEILLIDENRPAAPRQRYFTMDAVIELLNTLTRVLAHYQDIIDGKIEAEPITESTEEHVSTQPVPREAAPESEENSQVDALLHMFEDTEDDSDASSDVDMTDRDEIQDDPFDKILSSGQPDEELIIDIEFVLQVLRIWAHDRATQHLYPKLKATALKYVGKPDKPPPVKVHLRNTPEGKVISAFQDVLDAKCLRVGLFVPPAFGNALFGMYKQLEKLVQFRKKPDEEWRPYSYWAQIEANKVMVQRSRESLVQAEEECGRREQMEELQGLVAPDPQDGSTQQQLTRTLPNAAVLPSQPTAQPQKYSSQRQQAGASSQAASAPPWGQFAASRTGTTKQSQANASNGRPQAGRRSLPLTRTTVSDKRHSLPTRVKKPPKITFSVNRSAQLPRSAFLRTSLPQMSGRSTSANEKPTGAPSQSPDKAPARASSPSPNNVPAGVPYRPATASQVVTRPAEAQTNNNAPTNVPSRPDTADKSIARPSEAQVDSNAPTIVPFEPATADQSIARLSEAQANKNAPKTSQPPASAVPQLAQPIEQTVASFQPINRSQPVVPSQPVPRSNAIVPSQPARSHQPSRYTATVPSQSARPPQPSKSSANVSSQPANQPQASEQATVAPTTGPAQLPRKILIHTAPSSFPRPPATIPSQPANLAQGNQGQSVQRPNSSFPTPSTSNRAPEPTRAQASHSPFAPNGGASQVPNRVQASASPFTLSGAVPRAPSNAASQPPNRPQASASPWAPPRPSSGAPSGSRLSAPMRTIPQVPSPASVPMTSSSVVNHQQSDITVTQPRQLGPQAPQASNPDAPPRQPRFFSFGIRRPSHSEKLSGSNIPQDR